MLDVFKSNKLLLLITGILVLLICVGLLAFYFLNSKQEEAVPNPPPMATKIEQPVSNEAVPQVLEQEDSQTENFATLVDETLIEQPIADDPALLKDELVQLEDIQTQLKEQESMLEQQHNDADKLLALKEAQLAALEKQLAAE